MSRDICPADSRPSLALWEAQATHWPTTDGEAGAAHMATAGFTSGDLISDSGTPWQGGLAAGQPTVVDGAMVLSSLTELSYTPPRNTSLIRVLGPVGDNPGRPTGHEAQLVAQGFRGDFVQRCTAILEPAPAWFNASELPNAEQGGPRNITNSTLFLFPLDPTVQYTLKVLPRNNVSTCIVSGITTYPFH